MKRAINIFMMLTLAAALLTQYGCTDRGVIIDQNNEVANHNWAYLNKFQYTASIVDEKAAYNLYMNLRVGADYKYANMFVLITQINPGKTVKTRRYELTLANKQGEWLGKGSGNLYSYQLPFLTNYKFPAKGSYTFTIEQNMRDNPLRDVSDVGMRIEKTQ